jgi:hypothetical protein
MALSEVESSQVYVVFEVWGEGDGYTVFTMDIIFSTLEKAQLRAAKLVENNTKYGGSYAGSELPEKIMTDFVSHGYTIMSRNEFLAVCDCYGYHTKHGFLIESCTIDTPWL